jgi:hypothetical protein
MNSLKFKCIKFILCKHKNDIKLCNECIIISDEYKFINNFIKNYKIKLINIIKHSKKKYIEEYKYEATMFAPNTLEYKEKLKIAYEIKRIQMMEGEIAQQSIGLFYNWKNLKIGNKHGLDCMKNDNSIVIELKNKYNTMNHDSKKSVFDKLAEYKKQNNKTRCILGIINPRKNTKKLSKVIIHNNYEIEIIQGLDLFKLVFKIYEVDYTNEILTLIKNSL